MGSNPHTSDDQRLRANLKARDATEKLVKEIMKDLNPLVEYYYSCVLHGQDVTVQTVLEGKKFRLELKEL